MIRERILGEFRDDLHHHVPRKVIAGVICGAIGTVYALSNATLLFSGPLQAHIATGMGITLVSATVLGICSAFSSHYGPSVGQVQEIPVAYLAAMLALAGAGASASTLPTAVALICVATIIMGCLFLLVGTFRLSRLFRYVPFPVLSGFLAVVGWFISQGAITIIIGESATLATIGNIAEPAIAMKLAAAVAIAVSIEALGSRFRHPMMTPALILSAILGFNLVAWVFGVSGSVLEETRWIAALPESAGLWPPISIEEFSLVDWRFIAASLPMIAVMVGISMMATLMNVSALEINARRDIDMDWELKATGSSNLVVGVLGGVPGFVSLSNTLLALAIGGGSRLATLVCGLTCGAVMLVGTPLLRLMPLPVLAGVLLSIGINVLRARLLESRHALRPSEYFVVVAIFAASIAFDFLIAVLLGTLCAMVLFIIDYSRQEVVKVALSGKDFQSQAETSDARRRALEEHGDAILILRLQGFLFFGSADRLKHSIETHLRAKPHLRFLILDFGRVGGLDSAAVQSFLRIVDTARSAGVEVIFVDLDEEALHTLKRGGLSFVAASGAVLARDFDAALAQCERSILQNVDPAIAGMAARPLQVHFTDLLGSEGDGAELAGSFERVEIGPGMSLIEQGTESDDLYVLESGRVRVCFRTGAEELTVATLGPGAFVGEISFYLRCPRSASVISDGDVVAWRLDRRQLANLQQRAPDTVARFHSAIASMLAERLQATNRLLRFFAE